MLRDFFLKNHAVYEIMYKNVVEPERPHTTRRLRLAYWISEPTRAQSEAPAPAPTRTPTTPIRTHAL